MNKNRNNINNCLLEIAVDKKCDIIVLAEYNDDIKDLYSLLNNNSVEKYNIIPEMGGCERIKGLINIKYEVVNLYEHSRYKIVMIETYLNKLVLGMFHNVSKIHHLNEDQAYILKDFNDNLCKEENKYNTNNTLLIGDFNINPFESSCISADTLHAIPFIEEAKKFTRFVQGKEFKMFYNPSWKLYGSRNIPYTTYYYNNSSILNYYWHIYDQIIIRPQLINAFIDDSLTIIAETKQHKLMNKNIPDKNNYSDHLPLFCILKESEIN